MEERAHNIATKLLTSVLPPNSRFPLLCWNFDAFGMHLWVQPITVSIFHADSRAPGEAASLYLPHHPDLLIEPILLQLTGVAQAFINALKFRSSPAFLSSKFPYRESLMSVKCTSAHCAPPGH